MPPNNHLPSVKSSGRINPPPEFQNPRVSNKEPNNRTTLTSRPKAASESHVSKNQSFSLRKSDPKGDRASLAQKRSTVGKHSDSVGAGIQEFGSKDFGTVESFNCPFYQRDVPCCGGSGGVSGRKYPYSSDPNAKLWRFPKNNIDGWKTADLERFPNPFRQTGLGMPAWLANCAQILTFYGFYQEPIPESGIETYRVHQCEIRFFMEDGTIDVTECRAYDIDPGYLQGRLLRRHKIPMPSPSRDAYYTDADLDVGCEVEFYGKVFAITGCSDETRDFLNRQRGRSVPLNMEMPVDPYTYWRADRIRSQFPKRAAIDPEAGKLSQFLLNRGRILKFWAYWDDRCKQFGRLHQYILLYYLEDDTIEIKEILDPNDCNGGYFHFLKRGKLLKNYEDLVPVVGIKEEALAILNTVQCQNVCQSPAPKVRFMTDRLCPGIEVKEYITHKDLAIGAVISVYGRAFVITNCDEFTKQYYREKYSMQDFTPLVLEDEVEERDYPPEEPPPHNGFGSEEDTLYNWNRVIKKAPLTRYKNDESLYFCARFDRPLNNVNRDRRFTIKIYLSDNTMQIFEERHPNTGFKEGKFLQRSIVRKRGSKATGPAYELGEESEFYCPEDFYIGNILEINGFRFLLTSANETTLCYMECRYDIFPQSNLPFLVSKLREAVAPLEGQALVQLFSAKDTNLQGVMSAPDFRQMILCLTKNGLNEHELMTLTRGFRTEVPLPPPDMSTLRSVIQTELQKYAYDTYLLTRLEYTFRHHDPCRFGYVDRETVRSTLKGAKLPLDFLLIDFLVDNFPVVDDCCRINYCELMKFIDWVHNAVPRALPSHVACVMKWVQRTPPEKKTYCVNYGALLRILVPNLPLDLASVCCCPPDPPCDPVAITTSNCLSNAQSYFCEDSQNDLSYLDERTKLGIILNDSRLRSEDLRCDDEDMGVQEECCQQNSIWSPDPCVPIFPSPCPPCENEGELLRPGDTIGFEDLYTKPAFCKTILKP